MGMTYKFRCTCFCKKYFPQGEDWHEIWLLGRLLVLHIGELGDASSSLDPNQGS